MNKLFVGIDIGGTAIKAGLLSDKGEVLCNDRIPTRTEAGVQGILMDCLGLCHSMLSSVGAEQSAVVGIGMGVPGMVDGSVVTEATNLGWDKVELAAEFAKISSIPLRVANDADAAALGEVRCGAARGMKNVFMLTLGTGLGSGIIINGSIYPGNHGFGGEMGHVVLVSGGRKCCCGRRGCAELYLSAPALIRDAKAALRRHPESVLAGLQGFGTKEIFESSDTDELCGELVKRYTRRLSELCLNIANAFRPEAIILGGGISLAGEKLTAPVQRALDEESLARCFAPRIDVLPAMLGNSAGFIGAAGLWWE